LAETTALQRIGPRAALRTLADAVELAKPRITTMVVFTTAMGMWLAPGSVAPARAVAVLAMTALLVGSANVLNSFLERDVDAKMRRTCQRPIPSGRIDPWSALGMGLVAASFAVPGLVMVANPLTAAIGLGAWLLYVTIYTPLKRVTPWALEIGAIPGALPPLMGWTAVTGAIQSPGLALFAIMVFWQLPHFLSIALYLDEDYARGGIRVWPLVRGPRAARVRLALYTVALVAASASAAPLAGMTYALVAIVLGGGFLVLALRGLRPDAGAPLARRTMLYSLVYLTVLFGVLVADAR
jgi:protoheme IX farnesyltransferase